MTDITSLKSAARLAYDDAGKPVVQIPLPLWQEWLAQLEPENSQIAQITALLHQWADEPDDIPENWGDEFRQFLAENRLDFGGKFDISDE